MHIDNRRHHRWVVLAVAMRTIPQEAQHRRYRQRDAARSEVGFNRGCVGGLAAPVKIARPGDGACDLLDFGLGRRLFLIVELPIILVRIEVAEELTDQTLRAKGRENILPSATAKAMN